MVLNESLRMHPAVPYMNSFAQNHLRKFIPERFTEENKATRPKYTHFPFGEGPRICLGMRFAQMQIKALVSTILSEYNIEKTEKTPEYLTPTPTAFYLYHLKISGSNLFMLE
ncbi:hypothetical protein L9F63_023900, partial [Diploptera punctata]